MNSQRRLAYVLGMALACGAAGCVARYVRMEEKGLTCVEAYRIAIDAVRRMGYAISETSKAAPGTPGMIIGARQEGTNKEGILVQVFCTSQGAEVEAKSDAGGLAQLNFSNDFQRSFATAAANQGPPRRAAEHGVDVLMTPERGGGAASLGADFSAFGILPISVRITNHTARTYQFHVAGVVLRTETGERVAALPVKDVAAKLTADAAQTLRAKALGDHGVAPDETLTGYLFFPFNSYARARVELTDVASGETEGFAIEF